MAAENGHTAKEIIAIRRADGESRTLAASLPRLVLEARRVAANVIHGLHGRRRAGSGENFWQYRRFVSGEPSQNVDWRRSARDDHLYVRELEWEASHTVWIWPDRSPSMAFASKTARESKLERTLIVAFALAELLVSGGERVGIPGLMAPTASRSVIDKMAQAMLHDDADRLSLPPSFVPSALAEIIVLSDFWSPISEIRATLTGLSGSGAHGTMVQVVDPAEESFPYSGRVEFVEPEGFGVITAGRAESWAQDYTARLALHRDQIRAETSRLNWLFTTDRIPPRQGQLDVVQLHSILLDRILGLSQERITQLGNVRFLRDAAESIEQVTSGEADVAFLIKPITLEQLKEVSLSGDVMPQKSTDFYPKLLSGLAIYALD